MASQLVLHNFGFRKSELLSEMQQLKNNNKVLGTCTVLSRGSDRLKSQNCRQPGARKREFTTFKWSIDPAHLFTFSSCYISYIPSARNGLSTLTSSMVFKLVKAHDTVSLTTPCCALQYTLWPCQVRKTHRKYGPYSGRLKHTCPLRAGFLSASREIRHRNLGVALACYSTKN